MEDLMGKLLTPDAYVDSIFDITSGGLKEKGLYGVILDVDNTLVATHIKDADEKIIEYIENLKNDNIKCIIVSNGAKKRVELFSEPLGIEFVYKALKPLGRGFDAAIEKLGLPAENIAIIGDQLYTDILGGNIKKLHTILVKPIDLNEPFIIKLKRLFEFPFLRNKKFEDKY